MKKSISTAFLVAMLAVAISACSASTGQLTTNANLPASQAISQTAPTPAAAGSAEAPDGLFSEEQALVDLYQRVNPSVVNIRVVLKASASGATLPDFGNLPGFPNLPTPEAPQGVQQAEGSGFVLDKDGHIVTNNHVVGDAERITVTFADGSEAPAKLIGADPNSDLAVIKVDVEPSQLSPVTLGDSDSLKVGQITIAIGNPFGQNGSMSMGIVSGLERMLDVDLQTASGQSYSIPDVVQTDTAINPGNSGGPLINLKGEVIRVNTAIASPVRANSGVGYAVPVSIVKQMVPELIRNGRVQYPYLGIAGTTLTSDLARAMKLDPTTRGVLIAEVVTSGPAAKAGLKGSAETTQIDGLDAKIGGDVIVAVGDEPVKVFDDLLTYLVRHTKVGDTVTLKILRNGEPMNVQVQLGARPSNP